MPRDILKIIMEFLQVLSSLASTTCVIKNVKIWNIPHVVCFWFGFRMVAHPRTRNHNVNITQAPPPLVQWVRDHLDWQIYGTRYLHLFSKMSGARYLVPKPNIYLELSISVIIWCKIFGAFICQSK